MLPKKRQPTHPGEMLLKEFLQPMGITQKDFAVHLGWTYARLNEIVHGRRGVVLKREISCLIPLSHKCYIVKMKNKRWSARYLHV